MAILEFSNYTPDTQRNINTGARYWRGTVQAESASDSQLIIKDITGLAGLDTLSLTLTAPSGYQSADIPVIKLLAVLDGGVTVEVADLVPSPAVPRPSGVTGGQVFTAEIDLTDVTTITPAELYRIETQYSGSQDRNRLAPLDIYVIARGLGRGLGGGSGGVTPVPVPTPVLVTGGGRVENTIFEDTTDHTEVNGYRTITLSQDVNALEGGELQFEFEIGGRLLSFVVPLSAYNGLAEQMAAGTNTANALQATAGRGGNLTALTQFASTVLYVQRLDGMQLAYAFTSSRGIGNHQLTIRLIQYNSMFTLEDVLFAETWNPLAQTVRLSKADLIADGAGSGSAYIQVKRFDEQTWWIDMNLARGILVAPDIIHSSQVLCVFPPGARPAVDSWLYFGAWLHVTALDGTVRLATDLDQYTNGFASSFTTAVIPSVFAALPGIPQNVVQAATSSTEITLAWDIPLHDGNSPITNYNVAIYQRSPTFVLIEEMMLPATARMYTFAGLMPSTMYTANVAAINSQGTGLGGFDPTRIITTPAT